MAKSDKKSVQEKSVHVESNSVSVKMFFPQGYRLVTGELQLEANKIYDIPKDKVEKWLKRGGVIAKAGEIPKEALVPSFPENGEEDGGVNEDVVPLKGEQ